MSVNLGIMIAGLYSCSPAATRFEDFSSPRATLVLHRPLRRMQSTPIGYKTFNHASNLNITLNTTILPYNSTVFPWLL